MDQLEMEINQRLIARFSLPFINVTPTFCEICKLVSLGKYTVRTVAEISCKISLIATGSLITSLFVFCFIASAVSEELCLFFGNKCFYALHGMIVVSLLDLLFILSVPIMMVIAYLFIVYDSAIIFITGIVSIEYCGVGGNICSTGDILSYIKDVLIKANIFSPYLLMIAGVYLILYKDLLFFIWRLKPRPYGDSLENLLPTHLRGKLLLVRAFGHYAEITTEKGRIELRMPFSEAVRRIRDGSGMKIHRSHWVSNDIVRSVVKRGNRFFACTRYGDIPVSATMVKKITYLTTDLAERKHDKPTDLGVSRS